MTVRHRRRSVRAEAIAPWVTLSVILLLWWAGARALNWVRPNLAPSFSARVDPSVRKVDPVDAIPDEPELRARPSDAAISANTVVLGSDLDNLRRRDLTVPVRGLDADDLVSSFDDTRGSDRQHEAIDILAPRGTDVLAADAGRVVKLFTSNAGGLTVYQFDPSETFVYYYAHLDRYAPGLKEGMVLRKGDVIGSVGTTGNAPEGTPHLHFAISKLDPDRRWWGGTALDPYLVWKNRD
jgi:murein DD-endopeptidase MepM/ murein hydrolase activator NlpD